MYQILWILAEQHLKYNWVSLMRQKALWFLDLLMQKKEKKERAHDIGKFRF